MITIRLGWHRNTDGSCVFRSISFILYFRSKVIKLFSLKHFEKKKEKKKQWLSDKFYWFIFVIIALSPFASSPNKSKIISTVKSILKNTDIDVKLDIMLFDVIALKMKRKKEGIIWVNNVEFITLFEKWNLSTEKRITSKFWNYSAQHI